MIRFPIHFSKIRFVAPLCLCACSLPFFLGGCSSHEPTEEASLPSHYHTEATETADGIKTTEVSETVPVIETGATVSASEETIDMSSLMEEASIQIVSRQGLLGEFDFFTCNETQLFGDYSISLAEYAGEEYLMLSGGGIALLAKEDGTDAMLFYNDQMLRLPFLCYFNLDYDFLALHTGDFLQNGGHQLALIIPMASGSGVDIEQLQIIDLDTMSLVSLYTHSDSYEQEIKTLFDAHFDQTHPGLEYQLFQFVQYSIEDGLIFVEYGACDDDGNYSCFLDASLRYDGFCMTLDEAMTFYDQWIQ